jgi:hypothetical protein
MNQLNIKSQTKLKELVLTNPLVLLSIQDENSINFLNFMLPFSVGFEIECYQKETFNIKDFEQIPDIMEVNCDSYEQRFRIPPGLPGIICLYNISQALIKNSMLNFGSGIHYHVDLGKNYQKILEECSKVQTAFAWIEEELEQWNYKGRYNLKGVNWVRLNSLGTMEFRVGEMTFDYKILIKRILHATELRKKFQKIVIPNYPFSFEFNSLNRYKVFEYLKSLITKRISETESIKSIIKSRIVKK